MFSVFLTHDTPRFQGVVRRGKTWHRPSPDVLAQKQRAMIEIDKSLNKWLEAIPEQRVLSVLNLNWH